MNKAIMISIQPKWCELIANGQKTIEVRKNRPKLETPFKCYIYCTKAKDAFRCGSLVYYNDELYRMPKNASFDGGRIKFGSSVELMGCEAEYSRDNFLNGKVIGEFVVDKIENIYTNGRFWIEQYEKSTCLTSDEIRKYATGEHCYGWHISDLVIYDKPKELSEFKKINRECWYADLGLAKETATGETFFCTCSIPIKAEKLLEVLYLDGYTARQVTKEYYDENVEDEE